MDAANVNHKNEPVKKVLCPQCKSVTIRHYDRNIKPTGMWMCLNVLTCSQGPFFYNEPDLSTCSNADLKNWRDSQ